MDFSELINRDNKNQMTAKELMSILPHRYPMFMVDAIIDYDVCGGRWAIGKKVISVDSWYFPGHYPGNPIMPGSLILESMSQVATFLVLQDKGDSCTQKKVLMAGIKAMRFFKPVYPGNDLLIFCNIEKQKMGIYTLACSGEINGEVCITAEIILRKVDDI